VIVLSAESGRTDQEPGIHHQAARRASGSQEAAHHAGRPTVIIVDTIKEKASTSWNTTGRNREYKFTAPHPPKSHSSKRCRK